MSSISLKSTEQKSLRNVMSRTSTSTEIFFAISVSRSLKGCRDAGRCCREAGVTEGVGGVSPTEELH